MTAPATDKTPRRRPAAAANSAPPVFCRPCADCVRSRWRFSANTARVPRAGASTCRSSADPRCRPPGRCLRNPWPGCSPCVAVTVHSPSAPPAPSWLRGLPLRFAVAVVEYRPRPQDSQADVRRCTDHDRPHATALSSCACRCGRCGVGMLTATGFRGRWLGGCACGDSVYTASR